MAEERDYSKWPPAEPAGDELTVAIKRRCTTCRGWGDVGTGQAMLECDSEPSPITRPCPNRFCNRGYVDVELTDDEAAAVLANPDQLREKAEYKSPLFEPIGYRDF